MPTASDRPWAIRAPVETTACTMPVSIILEMTLPIFAIVMAPESVSTTLQSGSFTIASSTSKASPSERPLNAVFDIPRSRPANDVTLSRSRLSRGTRPSPRPSWNSRLCKSDLPFRSYQMRECAVRDDELRRRLDALYLQYDHRCVD